MNSAAPPRHDTTPRLRARVLPPRILAVALPLFAFSCLTLMAATKTWTGLSGGNWSASANWNPEGAPVDGDDLTFPNLVNGRTKALTNDLTEHAFGSLSFEANDYTLCGNSCAIAGGLTALHPAGGIVIDLNLVLNNNQTFTVEQPGAWLLVQGGIDLNGSYLQTAGRGLVELAGPIYGHGDLTQIGEGTLTLSGASPNTFQGITRVDAGTLLLNKNNGDLGLIAVPGPLIVGNATNAPDTLRLAWDDQIASDADVTVYGSGVLDLNGHTNVVGSLTLHDSATVNTGVGRIELTGPVTVRGSGGPARINGQLKSDVATTFDVANGTNLVELLVRATLDGPAFVKTGQGSFSLWSSNAFTGPFTVEQGELYVLNQWALGSTNGPTLVQNGATLTVGIFAAYLHDNLVLEGQGLGGVGALQSFGDKELLGRLTLTGDTTLNPAVGRLRLRNTIDGAGNFTKIGNGILNLDGSAQNSFVGDTWIREGTLELNRDQGAILGGSLTVGHGLTNPPSATVRYLKQEQIHSAVPVTVHPTGTLDLNGMAGSLENLALYSGQVRNQGSGVLTLGQTTSYPSDGPPAVISSRLHFPVTCMFDVQDDLFLEANISGEGGLTKTGPGFLWLSGSNSYQGLTLVQQGILDLANPWALGSSAAGTVVSNLAGLRLQGNLHIGMEPLTIQGAHAGGWAALTSYTGSNSWSGPITLAADTVLGVFSGSAYLNLSGPIDGPGGITQWWPGTLVLSGTNPNTFAGPTLVHEGTLVLNKNGSTTALPGSLQIGTEDGPNAEVRGERDGQFFELSAVHVTSSGLLNLNGAQQSLGTVSGTGTVQLENGFLSTFHNGPPTNFDGLIRGSGSLSKHGSGTWILNGNNTYSGDTRVDQGTLIVNGVQPNGSVFLLDGATLGGLGVVGAILSTNGIVSPGLSPGTLAGSNLVLDAESRLRVELTDAGADCLLVRGRCSLANPVLDLSAEAFAPADGQTLIILDNDGTDAVVGQFAGLSQDALIWVGTLLFRISYTGGTGNDVTLTFTETPFQLAEWRVWGGNGNGAIDHHECNLLDLVLTNLSGAPLPIASATLSSLTPGVAVTFPSASYPLLDSGRTATNTLPFQISTRSNFVCGTEVELLLAVQTAAQESFSMPVALPSGSVLVETSMGGRPASPAWSCADGGGSCESCPDRVVYGMVGDTSPTLEVLPISTEPSVCGLAKSCPTFISSDPLPYETHAFINGQSNTCVTIALRSATPLWCAAYLHHFNPSSLCDHYLGDCGEATDQAPVQDYSLEIPAGATFVVMVLGLTPGVSVPYELGVSGGSCQPVLHITRSGTNTVVLRWSTAAASYHLEGTPELTPPSFQPVLPWPVVVDGHQTVTNSLGNASGFYRLRGP